MKKYNLAKLFANAGQGRGNWGHRGRPGQVGGSAPGSGGGVPSSGSSTKKKKTTVGVASDINDKLFEKFEKFEIFDEDGEWNPKAEKYLGQLMEKMGKGIDTGELEEMLAEDISLRTGGITDAEWDDYYKRKGIKR